MNISILDYNEIFDRISSNKPYDRYLKVYSNEIIERAIIFFVESEEYEKCELLKRFIKQNEHDIGYTMF